MHKLIIKHCWFAETFLPVPPLISTAATVDSFYINYEILTSSVYLFASLRAFSGEADSCSTHIWET